VSSLTDNEMEVETSAATPGFLVTSDAYYPGWSATIDGQEARLYRADYAFRGVAVPAGNHVVKFTYRPRRFPLAAGVSLASVALLATVALNGLLRKRRLRHG
jgi:uncharacterized membrane protein YfhO